MQLLFATFTVSERLLHALSWTLLHSLWQGLAMALFAGLIMLISKRQTAQLRYNLLSILMLTFVLGISTTALVEWLFFKSSGQIPSIQYLSASEISGSILNETQMVQARSWFKTNVQLLRSLFEQNQLLLVGAWILMMSLKSIKMGLDIWSLYRMRWYRTYQPSLYWRNRLIDLATQIKAKQTVLLLESALVPGPSALGFFKPLILIPVGLLNNLPPEQVEAILLHELAHIRRNDYLVNFIQCLLENVFFFNPGLLWVSNLIRQERENCCDDLAIKAMKNKTLYVNALVAFQEYKLHGAQYALAFAGQKSPLLDRVKRIINHHHYKTLSIMEKISLLASVMLISAITFLSLQHTQAQSTKESRIPSFTNINISGSGTTANPQILFLQDVEGKTYNIKRVDKQIQEMYVNGEKLRTDQYAQYEAMIQEVDEQIARDRAQAEQDRARADRDRQQAERDRAQADRDRQQMEEDRTKANLDRLQAERDRQRADLDRLQAERDRVQADRDRAQADLDRLQADRDRAQAERDHLQADKDRLQAEKDRKEAQALLKSLVDAMVKDQLVKDKESIQGFRLTEDAFVINGVRQSAELHAKYREKFLKRPGFGIHYGSDGRSGNGYFFGRSDLK